VKVKPAHYYNQLVRNEITTVYLETHIQNMDTLCGYNTCSPYIHQNFFIWQTLSILPSEHFMWRGAAQS